MDMTHVAANWDETAWLRCLDKKGRNLDRARNIYANSMLGQFVLPNGWVVLIEGVNASGKPLTTDDNTWKSLSDLASEYYEHPDVPEQYKNVNDFIKFMRLRAFGDDVIYSLVIDGRDINLDSLSRSLLQQTTTGTISSAEEATFLQASFRLEQGMWVPRYNIRRFMASVMLKPSVSLENSFLKCAAIRRLACWDSDVFDVLDAWCVAHAPFLKEWSGIQPADMVALLIPRTLCQRQFTSYEGGRNESPNKRDVSVWSIASELAGYGEGQVGGESCDGGGEVETPAL
jgi:hypothetical protein